MSHKAYIVVCRGEVLTSHLHGEEEFLFSIQNLPTSIQPDSRYMVAEYSNQSIYLLSASKETQFEESIEWRPLRRLLSEYQDSELHHLFSRACQLDHWLRDHRFCSRCGYKMRPHSIDLALECQACGFLSYPRISPCVIMLVIDGDRCLLAYGQRFKERRFSTLAGFIEAGESAEQAVSREVFEEVGLRVKNIRYQGSQCWAMPDSLMLAYYADYESGELQPDGVEILEAEWFNREQLSQITWPSHYSIAHELVQGFMDFKHLKNCS